MWAKKWELNLKLMSKNKGKLHKGFSKDFSIGMTSNIRYFVTCDPILENPTYHAKRCFELFTVLGW